MDRARGGNGVGRCDSIKCIEQEGAMGLEDVTVSSGQSKRGAMGLEDVTVSSRQSKRGAMVLHLLFFCFVLFLLR